MGAGSRESSGLQGASQEASLALPSPAGAPALLQSEAGEVPSQAEGRRGLLHSPSPSPLEEALQSFPGCLSVHQYGLGGVGFLPAAVICVRQDLASLSPAEAGWSAAC